MYNYVLRVVVVLDGGGEVGEWEEREVNRRRVQPKRLFFQATKSISKVYVYRLCFHKCEQ